MTDRSSPESASEKLAAKFENCDHAAFYFDAGKDEVMRREALEPEDHDLIVAALRSFADAQTGQQPVAWRYRTPIGKDEWMVVLADEKPEGHVRDLTPLFALSGTSTDRAGK